MILKGYTVLKLLITFILAINFVGVSNAEAQIVESDSWIRELPRSSSVTAAYTIVENLGNNDDKLTEINSAFADGAGFIRPRSVIMELHE